VKKREVETVEREMQAAATPIQEHVEGRQDRRVGRGSGVRTGCRGAALAFWGNGGGKKAGKAKEKKASWPKAYESKRKHIKLGIIDFFGGVVHMPKNGVSYAYRKKKCPKVKRWVMRGHKSKAASISGKGAIAERNRD
jgi:hypothetical protein